LKDIHLSFRRIGRINSFISATIAAIITAITNTSSLNKTAAMKISAHLPHTICILILLSVTSISPVTAQNVGIATTAPGYPLDVNGRVRLRYNGSFNTAGIWFNNSLNTEAAFVGMFNDSVIGVYANGYWRVGVDFKNERFGIGTMAPKAKLDVAGSVKITDGTQAAGKVLTSDANGNATWAAPKNSNTGFRAWLPKTSIPSGTAIFPTNWNTSTNGGFADGMFNSVNGIYFAPHSGVYRFDLALKPDKTQPQFPTVNGYYTISIFFNTTVVASNAVTFIANTAYPDNNCSGIIKLNGGDQIRVVITQYSNAAINFGGVDSFFSGYQVY
jgi:hypothetical protein